MIEIGMSAVKRAVREKSYSEQNNINIITFIIVPVPF